MNEEKNIVGEAPVENTPVETPVETPTENTPAETPTEPTPSENVADTPAEPEVIPEPAPVEDIPSVPSAPAPTSEFNLESDMAKAQRLVGAKPFTKETMTAYIEKLKAENPEEYERVKEELETKLANLKN